MVAGKSDSSSLAKREHGRKQSKKHPARTSAKHWVQVERLGQPLVNEVIIPRGLKDYWNSVGPDKDNQFEKYYTDQDKPGQLINALNGLLLKPLLTGCSVRPRPRPARPVWPRRPGAPTSRRSCSAASSTRTTRRRARPDVRQGRRGQARRRAAAQHDDPGHAFRQGRPAWSDLQLRRRRRLPGSHGPGLQSCAVRRLSQRPAARRRRHRHRDRRAHRPADRPPHPLGHPARVRTARARRPEPPGHRAGLGPQVRRRRRAPNDANGGLFGNTFPYLNSPNSGNK